MPELSPRRRLLVLAICCSSLFMVGLDVTIVNVALPSIKNDLHASISGLQWTLDAYTVVLASLLMLAGSTADRLGRRRVFQTGLLLFTLASGLCSVAPSLGWLVAFRMLQAIGGSMLNPVAMSIITNTFTEPRERARAIGVWGGVIGISLALGPVIGGGLVGSIGWRAIFWINIPVGLAAWVLAARFVPESRAPHPRRLDPVGQVLVIAVLASLTYAIIEGPSAGFRSARTLGIFAFAALGLVALIGYERRRVQPLIEVRLFRSAPFSGATAIAVFAFASLGGFLFLNTLYLQDVRGLSALHAGLYTLPMAGMTLIFAPISGRLVASHGPRRSLVAAGLAMTVATLMLTRLETETPLAWLFTAYAIFGFGFGVVNAPITNTAVSGLPREQAGVAAAFASTSRQIGSSLGVAVIGSAATARVVGSFRSGFAEASHVGWWILTGCALAVLVLGVLTTGRWARSTAETATERLREPAPEAELVSVA
jgi:EmrB/QacA subfamily drug resistance transporter